MKTTITTFLAISFLTAAPVIAQTMGSGGMGPDMMGQQQQMQAAPNQEYGRHMQAEMMNRGYGGMMGNYGMMPMMGGMGMPPCTLGGGYNMMGGFGKMGHSGMMPMMGGYGMMAGPGLMGGPGMMQTQGLENLKKYENFARETKALRKKLHDLMFDYGEARWNQDTTVGDLNKMAAEMNQLREEIQKKMPQ